MNPSVSPPWELLVPAFGVVAALYASVGHAGATGYLAIMALAGVAPTTIRPTALVLNLVVGGIVTLRFAAARQIDVRTLAPLIVTSIPAAAIGATVNLPAVLYRPLVAVILLVASARLAGLLQAANGAAPVVRPMPIAAALAAGAALGLLAGLTGTGGGVVLTPALILAGWSTTRQAAGLSGAFIVVNSAAGILAAPSALSALPSALPLGLVSVALGGSIGAELGARRLPTESIRRLLALVLLIAAGKILLAP